MINYFNYVIITKCVYALFWEELIVEAVRTAVTIAFIVISIVLIIVVLMQEGKENGLSGALTGSSDSYWAKNKGRSKDSVIKKVTVCLAVLFFVLAILIRSKWLA